MKKYILVWFKRDLRIHDHLPLQVASTQGTIIPVYVIEDEYWQQPTSSDFHWRFIRRSLFSLNQALERIGSSLLIFNGDVIKIFNELYTKYRFKKIVSHQETGIHWTYSRDIKVKQWCKEQSIIWEEFAIDGIIRGLQTRKNWAKERNKQIFQDPIKFSSRLCHHQISKNAWRNPIISGNTLNYNLIQVGGREQALELLSSFLKGRGSRYQQSMSSPVTAEQACSRLSPHLAYGNISVREILDELAKTNNQISPRQINAFRTRLIWRTHFMQKFETMPEIEWQNMHPYYRGLRDEAEPSLLVAWQLGRTGYPFIDACMRYLLQHGWINFRMRAMLVSFASYNLWIDWRVSGEWLARLFTDFEPGIHFSQIQMQSGVTGINAPRVYNPIKQSYDQDPTGAFIKTYVPELNCVPEAYIHTPWELPDLLQKELNFRIGVNYPAPVIDLKETTKKNRDRLWAIKKEAGFEQASKVILEKLTTQR